MDQMGEDKAASLNMNEISCQNRQEWKDRKCIFSFIYLFIYLSILSFSTDELEINEKAFSSFLMTENVYDLFRNVHVDLFLPVTELVKISYIKGIVSKLTTKFLEVPEMWQNESLQQKNDFKCCRMITNTLDMIIIAK
jgi:hypothetical protein